MGLAFTTQADDILPLQLYAKIFRREFQYIGLENARLCPRCRHKNTGLAVDNGPLKCLPGKIECGTNLARFQDKTPLLATVIKPALLVAIKQFRPYFRHALSGNGADVVAVGFAGFAITATIHLGGGGFLFQCAGFLDVDAGQFVQQLRQLGDFLVVGIGFIGLLHQRYQLAAGDFLHRFMLQHVIPLAFFGPHVDNTFAVDIQRFTDHPHRVAADIHHLGRLDHFIRVAGDALFVCCCGCVHGCIVSAIFLPFAAFHS